MSEHVRDYSQQEHTAFGAVSHREWGQPYAKGAGPAQHAAGPYWPEHLRLRAKQLQRLIPLYLLAAAALEREIAADPRCTAPHPPPRDPAAASGEE